MMLNSGPFIQMTLCYVRAADTTDKSSTGSTGHLVFFLFFLPLLLLLLFYITRQQRSLHNWPRRREVYDVSNYLGRKKKLNEPVHFLWMDRQTERGREKTVYTHTHILVLSMDTTKHKNRVAPPRARDLLPWPLGGSGWETRNWRKSNAVFFFFLLVVVFLFRWK